MSNLTLADLTDDERERLRVAVHEAGHAVWAVLCGAQVHAITASADNGGHVEFSGHDDARGAEIAYAGIYAEALFTYGGIPPLAHLRDAWRNVSPEDRALIGETINPPRRIESSIEYVMPRVRDLAKYVYKRGHACHADVEAVLGIGPHVPASLVASSVRSRLGWPVSGRRR
ncbi:M50 family metallopeptidase [Nocardia asteroides]